MKLRFLKQIILMAGILSALVVTAACPRRTSNCRKPRYAPVIRSYQSKVCGRPSLKVSRKSKCGNKTTVIIRKKRKCHSSGGCNGFVAPGRYHVRFEKQTLTNGFEQIEFRRPVRTRY